MISDHAHGQDGHATVPSTWLDYVGAAEGEQRCECAPRDALHVLALGVCLRGPAAADAACACVALGYDGEEPAWPNRHVIDVAPVRRDVVEDVPLRAEGRERAADRLLAIGAL